MDRSGEPRSKTNYGEKHHEQGVCGLPLLH
jgi:hypothetical protein